MIADCGSCQYVGTTHLLNILLSKKAILTLAVAVAGAAVAVGVRALTAATHFD